MTYPYQAFYCEENVWQLCNHVDFRDKEAWAVVVTNAQRLCPVWGMRIAESDRTPVFWDYHVFFVHDDKVWDQDTTLGFPVGLQQYFGYTFHANLKPELAPRFRILAAKEYRTGFHSDRSHMLDRENRWLKPPPDWAAITTKGSLTLDDLLDVHKTISLPAARQLFGLGAVTTSDRR